MTVSGRLVSNCGMSSKSSSLAKAAEKSALDWTSPSMEECGADDRVADAGQSA
jgi:hypothetical protein